MSLVISRQILTDFTTQLSRMPDAVAKEVSHFTLEKIQARVISFEEQVCIDRFILLSTVNCVLTHIDWGYLGILYIFLTSIFNCILC